MMTVKMHFSYFAEVNNMGIDVPSKMVERAAQLFELRSKQERDEKIAKPKVITISRELGSGGRIIADELSKILNCKVYDEDILKRLSENSAWSVEKAASMFEQMDEEKQGWFASIIASTLDQLDRDTYFYLLPKVIFLIAQNDAIILGRGAHFLLTDALNIRVKASMQTRIKNLCEFEDYSLLGARDAILRSDNKRRNFLVEMAHNWRPKLHKGDYEFVFDLEINSDQINAQTGCNIVYEAVKQFYAT